MVCVMLIVLWKVKEVRPLNQVTALMIGGTRARLHHRRKLCPLEKGTDWLIITGIGTTRGLASSHFLSVERFSDYHSTVELLQSWGSITSMAKLCISSMWLLLSGPVHGCSFSHSPRSFPNWRCEFCVYVLEYSYYSAFKCCSPRLIGLFVRLLICWNF